MKYLNIKNSEYLLGLFIFVTFITYYFDLLKDGMMMSGVIAVVILLYTSFIFSEKVVDERDDYIRSKVDRYLYMITLVVILISIIYKTFAHLDYMSEVLILTALSFSKIFLSKVIKNNN